MAKHAHTFRKLHALEAPEGGVKFGRVAEERGHHHLAAGALDEKRKSEDELKDILALTVHSHLCVYPQPRHHLQSRLPRRIGARLRVPLDRQPSRIFREVCLRLHLLPEVEEHAHARRVGELRQGTRVARVSLGRIELPLASFFSLLEERAQRRTARLLDCGARTSVRRAWKSVSLPRRQRQRRIATTTALSRAALVPADAPWRKTIKAQSGRRSAVSAPKLADRHANTKGAKSRRSRVPAIQRTKMALRAPEATAARVTTWRPARHGSATPSRTLQQGRCKVNAPVNCWRLVFCDTIVRRALLCEGGKKALSNTESDTCLSQNRHARLGCWQERPHSCPW